MEAPGAEGHKFGVWSGLALLYARASSATRREFVGLLALMLAGAAAELATIGSVIPFLALLSHAADRQLPGLANLFATLGSHLGTDRLVATAIIFATFAIITGLVRLLLTWVTQHLAYRLAHELALETHRRVLAQPYEFHIERNSSTFAAMPEKVEILVHDVILPIMQTIIAGFIAAFLIGGLLYLSPLATLIAAATFASIYLLVSVVSAKRLAANSAVVGTGYHERLQMLQESLAGIRDVIVDNSQAMHASQFEQVNSRLGRARASSIFIGQAPRYIVESVGMVLVAALAVLLSRAGGIGMALPFLGALAIGAQRLLPLVQSVYSGWSSVRAQRSVFSHVLEMLSLPAPDGAGEAVRPLDLRRGIAIDGVTFTYRARAEPAIDHVSLEIPRGTMVALVGPTGSGKSTLVDALMGLLPPQSGRILIDDVPLDPTTRARWHRSIAHVPQSIFLVDATIARNVALSLPDEAPDLQRIVEATKKAQLHQFITSLPDGYDTLVGERGVRLSGGQRQRLGIARAIYKGAPILVLDEATSALDDRTEAGVIGALEELRREGRTIVIVAHRQSTIRHCDLIARLEHGRLVQFGPMKETPAAPPKGSSKAAARRR